MTDSLNDKRPNFAVFLHDVMEQYVQQHSVSLSKHQVRDL